MRYQIIDGFLNAEQCKDLINMALPRLERSAGWDVVKGENTYTDYRNSSQMHFRRGENPLIASIEEKIADYTNTPVVNGEDIQLLMYKTGQHYRQHWDWFDPDYPQNRQILQRGGQRILTFMIYLNEVDNGGETHFPRVPNEDKSDSLKIKPKTGRAIMWWNVDEQGKIERDSLHEGLDPLNGSMKFIITRWIRQETFV